MIAFDNRDDVAEAAAFRLGIHEGLSKVEGSRMVAAAGKVVEDTIFCVVRFTGFPRREDNGWQLITAPDKPEFHRMIEGVIRANFTGSPIVKPVQQPGRN